MAALPQFTVSRYVYSGNLQKRGGNRHIWNHPITVYPCRDGRVSICAGTEDQAEMLLALMGKSDALQDPRFADGLRRRLHADTFDAMVRPWFLARTKQEIVEICQEWRVPAGPVNNLSDLYEDAQLRARGFWAEIGHPRTGRLPYAGAPFRMSETPAVYDRAPLMGEHNEEVYLERLGLTRWDMERLRRDRVI
jgi:crotonobetainyl-CoA:carnitine CoA-transferase CaiB-like acyl-CoA transferase